MVHEAQGKQLPCLRGEKGERAGSDGASGPGTAAGAHEGGKGGGEWVKLTHKSLRGERRERAG